MIVTSSFLKSFVFKMFSFHAKSPKTQSLRFRDGLVWTVGLTVEIKLRFQISPAKCARSLRADTV